MTIHYDKVDLDHRFPIFLACEQAHLCVIRASILAAEPRFASRRAKRAGEKNGAFRSLARSLVNRGSAAKILARITH